VNHQYANAPRAISRTISAISSQRVILDHSLHSAALSTAAGCPADAVQDVSLPAPGIRDAGAGSDTKGVDFAPLSRSKPNSLRA
jgi:hypothetical protein